MENTETGENIEEKGGNGPRVSVLMFVQKTENLSDCLKSLRNQILDDMEVFCIVNEADEVSLNMIRDYSKNDARMKLVRCKANNYSKVLNQGIKFAKGEYIGFIDSNNFIDPEMYIELFALAKKHNADVVRSNYYDFKDGQNIPHETILAEETGYVINPIEDTRIFYEPPIVGSGLYRKDFLIEQKIDFLETNDEPSCSDVSFNFKTLATEGKVVLTDKPYLHCRIETNDVPKNIFAINDEYAEIESFLKKRNTWKTYCYIFQAVKFASYHWNMLRLPKKQVEKFLLRMRAEFHDAEVQKTLDKRYFPKNHWKALKAILKYPPQVFLTIFKSYSRKKK